MTINSVYITAFGKLSNITIDLSSSLTVVQGENETGKSTLWTFIKFIFYGLDKTERERFVPWGKDGCGGYLTLTFRGKDYRVQRELLLSRAKDKVGIYDALGVPYAVGESPADFFLGVPEYVFTNTAFTPQLGGAAVNGQNMPEAIENILFSADEMVNTGKALKVLDDMRVALLHKNKKGGEIFELENTVSGLQVTLDTTKKSAARIFELEDRIRISGAKRKENREKCANISSQLDEYEAYEDMKRVGKAEEAKKQLEAARAELAGLEASFRINGFLPDAEYLAKLKAFENEAAEAAASTVRADGALASAQSALARCDTDTAKRVDAVGGAERIMDLTEGFKTHVSRNRIRGIAFGIISLLPLAAGVVFAAVYKQFTAAGVCAALFLLLVILAVVFTVKSSKMKHSLSLLYAKFGVEGQEQLSELFERAGEADSVRHEAEKVVEECGQGCIDARANQARLEERIAEYTGKYRGTTASDLGVHIDEVEELLQKLSEAGAETEKLEYAARLQAEQAAKIDVEATRARLRGRLKPEDVTRFDPANKRLELNVLTAANESLTDRINDNERELAAAKATQTTSPAAVADKLCEVNGRLAEARADYEAYVLASDKLREASRRLRESVSPRLCELSGKYMSAFTNGKYDSIGVAHDLSLTYTSDGFSHPAESLSGGTLDAAYISLRLALCDILYTKDGCPVFFDDSFVHIDDRRLTYIISALSKLSTDRQLVVLSCHSREGLVASRLGGKVVELTSAE